MELYWDNGNGNYRDHRVYIGFIYPACLYFDLSAFLVNVWDLLFQVTPSNCLSLPVVQNQAVMRTEAPSSTQRTGASGSVGMSIWGLYLGWPLKPFEKY